jgi:hypothetical protein
VVDDEGNVAGKQVVLSKASLEIVGLTKPHAKWAHETLPLGTNRPQREAYGCRPSFAFMACTNLSFDILFSLKYFSLSKCRRFEGRCKIFGK